MKEPHETPEGQERLEAWLDRYAVTPKADLEHLLSKLPPQEAPARARPWGGWVASGARWGGLLDLWRPAALAALPVADFKDHLRLGTGFADDAVQDGVLEGYDIVLIDTPPALGYLTINGLSAADILLVPLGASFLEFDSTGRFFDMLHATFSSIEDNENMAARALGLGETRFEWDAVRAVITRYDGAQQAEMAALMQAYMGDSLSPWRQDYTALIGQAGEQVAGIYEADYRDFNRETYARGRAAFDETYAGFKRLLVGAWRRDELAASQAAE